MIQKIFRPPIRYPKSRVRLPIAQALSARLALSRYRATAVVELRSKNALLGIRSASSRLLAHLSLLADDEGYLAPRGSWTAVTLEVGMSHEAV